MSISRKFTGDAFHRLSHRRATMALAGHFEYRGRKFQATQEWAIAATHQVPCFYVPYEKIKKNAASNSLFQWQFWLELPS